MKLLIIRKAKDCDGTWHISNVMTNDVYPKMGIEEIKQKCAEKSGENYKYETIDIDDDFAEIFRFMLGEKEYMSLPSLRSLSEQIEQLHEWAKDVENTISDIRDDTDLVVNEFREMLKTQGKDVDE